MNIKYEHMLHRLEEERIKSLITQSEISRKLGMLQSHYCKAENGHNFFGFNELCKMCNMSLNVYYIFTGRYCDKDYDYLLSAATFDKLLLCLKYINMIAQQNKDNIYWAKIYSHTRYIEFAERTVGAEKNIFKATRINLGKKQIEMAKKLGVDVKKLRALEVNDLLPNSELIFEMYKLFGISPSLFLRNKKCLQDEISCLIDMGDKEIRKKIISIIEFTLANI